MHSLPKNVQKLIDHFVRLPGIGPKTASRLVLYLLHSSDSFVVDFAQTLSDLKSKVRFCTRCFNLAEDDLCSICKDESREGDKIMVVEDVLDLFAFESMGDYHGLYHVLGGVIAPIQGIGPDDLTSGMLIKRVKDSKGGIGEMILAMNPNLEGEATASYIKGELLKLSLEGLRISRIARGLPTGADLDYADKVTLLKSLQGRVEY
ncbi:MAG TPA: recombination mediator RecR [Candidatus Dojkabacteria bacterium]|nr:recombination mediator RecR [Candidatus Dojkabacteria bacterium]